MSQFIVNSRYFLFEIKFRHILSYHSLEVLGCHKALWIWVLLSVAMTCLHPQPFSLERRELRVLFPLLWERARVRAALGLIGGQLMLTLRLQCELPAIKK